MTQKFSLKYFDITLLLISAPNLSAMHLYNKFFFMLALD